MHFQNDSRTGSMQNRPLQQIGKAEGRIEEDKWDTICSRTEGRTQNVKGNTITAVWPQSQSISVI